MANKAFSEAISIDREFNVQNDTAAASLDKCKKAANELKVELGERLEPIMMHCLESGNAVMRSALESIRYLSENKATLIALTAAIAGWTLALNANLVTAKLRMAVMKADAALSATARTLTLALSAAYNGLTGNITRATAATKLLNSTMKANIFGLIATAVAIVTAKFIDYRNKALDAAKAQKQLQEEQETWRKSLTDIDRQSADYAQKERARLDALYKAATDQTKSQKERIKAVNELKKLYPEYFSKISTELIMIGHAKKQYDELTTAIVKAANARAANDKIAELGSEKLDHEISEDKINAEIRQKTTARDTAQRTYDQAAAIADKWKTREIDFKEYNRQVMIRNTALVELNKLNKDIAELIKKRNADRDKIREISSAQSDLSKKYGVDINAAIAGDSDTPENPQPIPYVSAPLSEQERKQQEAEARRAAAKERKEFKDALESIKGERAAAEAHAMADRAAGLTNYLEYIEAMRSAEVKFYDDAAQLYENSGLQEDEDYKTLLKNRQEADEKYIRNKITLNKDATERIAAMEEREINARYAVKGTLTFADQLAKEEELLTVRFNKLMDIQSLYQKESREWEETGHQIDDLLAEDQEKKQKAFNAKIAEFQKKFDKESIADKYKLEEEALRILYENKKITEEQYQKWLKGIREQDAKELPGAASSTPASNAAAAQARYNRQKAELDKAHDAGLIDDDEYDARLRRIGGSLRDDLLEPLKNAKSEWVSLMTTMVDSWMDFADALKDPDGNPLGALGAGMEATAAVVNAVMSQMTTFMQAELKIQTAAVEKRYDKEIAAAEGNSYRTAKLEKQKEAEIAKLKNDANRKMFAMQVIQAVAQTATNALNAYGSTVVIPVIGPTLAPIAAAVAAAAGAVQIAAIKKQQQAAESSGYSQGGFTKPGRVDEPAGVVHAGEWVASQKLLSSPVARAMINTLDYAQRTNTIGSLRSDDVSRSITAQQSLVRFAESDNGSMLMAAVAARMSEAVDDLTDRLERPFVTVATVTGDAGINHAQEEYLRLMRNKSPKSRKSLKHADSYKG